MRTELASTQPTRSFRIWTAAVALAAFLVPAQGAYAQASDADPSIVLTTTWFQFRSHFATNLNDALLEAGRARNSQRPDLFADGEPRACFEALPLSARIGWGLAVEYYAKVVSPASWSSEEHNILRIHLAGYDELVDDGPDREFLKVTAGFWDAAVPAYRECYWPNQDAANRALAAALEPLLHQHGETIADRLLQLYDGPWGATPYQYDLVETVNWAGATSYFLRGGRGLILMSTGNPGMGALETVFHEASHGWMFRRDPIQVALREAAEQQDVELPRDLWHVVLFMTTGEVVRQVLEAAGHSDYRPYIYEIFDRGDWTEMRDPVERAWLPYLRGERSMQQAAQDLVSMFAAR